uniref:Uncharacterized protein n=1 Tax=Panagrolaimus superbus TaxID=310955 RepID=A0A914Z493_9BILA
MHFINIIFLLVVFLAAVSAGENGSHRIKRHDMLHGDKHFYVVHHHEDKKSEEKDNDKEHHMTKRVPKEKRESDGRP